MYYRGAQAAIVVYDVTNRVSFVCYSHTINYVLSLLLMYSNCYYQAFGRQSPALYPYKIYLKPTDKIVQVHLGHNVSNENYLLHYKT